MSMFSISSGPRNPLISILLGILMIVGIYYLITGVYNLLWYISPVLLISAAVLHLPTVVSYGKNLIEGVRRDAVKGSLILLANVLFFPITFAYLLLKAVASRKLDRMRTKFKEKGTSESPIFDAFFSRNAAENQSKRHQSSAPKTNPSDEEYTEYEELPPTKSNPEPVPRTDPGRFGNTHDDLFK